MATDPRSHTGLSREDMDALLDRAFAEDLGKVGDITSDSVIPTDARLTATLNARQDMTVAGLPLVEAAFLRQDPDADITLWAWDGDRVTKDQTILTVSGDARALLIAERTALNTLQHMSGIATMTAGYVDQIKDLSAKLLDTRKTHPGLRKIQKYAAHMGGAVNHRMGLYDAVMIKDNHIAVAGSVSQAIKAAQSAGHSQIQVECDTIAQVKEAVDAGATSLLLDNMSPQTLREALSHIPQTISTEASGGVTIETIRAIAETGVDYVSVGRITQSAPAVDIGMDFDQKPKSQ